MSRAFGVYLDESAFAYDIAAALEAHGYRVITPRDVGLLGAPDEEHLEYASTAGIPLLTRDSRDFGHLHMLSGSTAAAPRHSGILAVYEDNDPAKDMSPREIARAIANLLAAAVPIAGEFHVLNRWRY